MSEVNEMFGMYTGGAPFPDLTKALQTQKCPFNGRQCYKTRKSAGIEVVEHIMGGQSDGESEYRTFCQTLAARMKDEYRFTPVINH